MLARETVTDVDWDGASVPAGTQVLIVNTLFHRDPDTHDFADRFAPEAWTDGGAGEDWSFNHLSHGPQGCPGSGLALFLGTTMLSAVLTDRQVELLEPKLNPDRPLPHMLDFFGLRFRLEPACGSPSASGSGPGGLCIGLMSEAPGARGRHRSRGRSRSGS
jgi:cytochrome P450